MFSAAPVCIWGQFPPGLLGRVALLMAALALSPRLAESKCGDECEHTARTADAGKVSQRSLLQAVVVPGKQNGTGDNSVVLMGNASVLPLPLETLANLEVGRLAAPALPAGFYQPSGRQKSEVLVEEGTRGVSAAVQPPSVVVHEEIPVVRHARVDESWASLFGGWLWFQDILGWLLLLFLLLLICCICGLCLSRHHHDAPERLVLKPNPRLVQTVSPPVVYTTDLRSEDDRALIHVHYKEGAERVFTTRGLQISALDAHTRTENEIWDAAGRSVFKTFVTMPREGLVDVWRATSFARAWGYQTKDRPIISLHSPPPPGEDPRTLGPLYACCRGAPSRASSAAGEGSCMYFYDADDHLFASMQRHPYLGSSKYVVSANGIRLTFSGNVSAHEMQVTEARGEQVAIVQQCTRDFDPSGQCYSIRMLPAADWSTVVIVLIALQAIEVLELMAKLPQTRQVSTSFPTVPFQRHATGEVIVALPSQSSLTGGSVGGMQPGIPRDSR